MMELVHIAGARGPLLSSIQPAASSSSGEIIAVLCPPWGQESIRAHRAMLELSRGLAAAGCHALRFDYTGCGDSWGDESDASVEQWIDDIGAVVDEARGVIGPLPVVLVGLRLGAALAWEFARRRGDGLAGVVAWEPVVRGSAYLAELRATHRTSLEGTFIRAGRGWAVRDAEELLGFPLPTRLRDGIDGLDLLGAPSGFGGPVLVVSRAADGDARRLGEMAAGDWIEANDKQFWQKKRDALEQSLVPSNTIEGIVSWIAARRPATK